MFTKRLQAWHVQAKTQQDQVAILNGNKNNSKWIQNNKINLAEIKSGLLLRIRSIGGSVGLYILLPYLAPY
jgi:hypothetical protein